MREIGEMRPRRRDHIVQPAYVLFASTFARDFYAVVPTYSPIPSLLLGPGWRFVRILKGSGARRQCLLKKSTGSAIERDGYYLFADGELSAARNEPVVNRDH